jgi:hypothetical protein
MITSLTPNLQKYITQLVCYLPISGRNYYLVWQFIATVLLA